jgi:uncharacterized protein (UPF0210 family)
MNIRSITVFMNPGWPLDEQALQAAGDFIAVARKDFEGAGYEVQTTRLATPPFPRWLREGDLDRALGLAQALDSAVVPLGFEYASLGPALPDRLEAYEWIPEMLAVTERVFLSGVLSSAQGGISLPAVQACARVIQRTASLDPNGFGNLYFAALANVPPGSPFFPAAYHDGEAPTFALAIEAADLAVGAFTPALTLKGGRQALIARIEDHGRALTRVGRDLEGRFDFAFGGIDFSLAPYPEEMRSLGTAMERLGTPAVGRFGSLAAAAVLAATLDQAVFPRAGFSGLFLPVLEDAALAHRAAEGTLLLADLLLYSAVCGTGLDTIPLPGDVTPEQIAPLLLDLAALAQRLEKPLTARLMPIPGKRAGDPTDFDFPYFANSRVMPLDAAPLRNLLDGEEVVHIESRGRG